MLYLLLIPLVTLTSAFNIDVDIPLIRKGDQDGSYFGFSVALHRFKEEGASVNSSWLLVGTPKANDSELTKHNIWNSGALYNCDILNSDSCQQINMDTNPNNKEDNTGKTTEDKNNQWFGVSVASGGYDGYVLACAHRYLYRTTLSNYHTFPGRCLGSPNIYFVKVGKTTFNYCQRNNQDDANDNAREPDYERYKYCQMGVSSAVIPGDKPEGTPIIGSPGQFNYEGAVLYYDVVGANPSSVLRKNESALGYQGYSMAYGKFFNQKKKDVASGAPRYDHVGMVVVFKATDSGFTMGRIIHPEIKEPGTGFGYSLSAIDFNKDGWSDLLVGAPFYSEKGLPGEGKVYVYQNNGGNFELQLELVTRKRRANFGRAMAALGDINLDGYDDVAIGAPYEDDIGTVYIYQGSAQGLKDKPSQIIRGSDITGPPKSFGYSISGGQDMDQNGYPDILVGAYLSDTVVLLRTKPVISVKSNITIEPPEFDVRQQKTCTQDYLGKSMPTICFNITVCSTYEELSGILSDTLAVVMTMESDVNRGELGEPRVLFRSNNKDTVNKTEENLQKSVPTCFKWQAFLRSEKTAEYPDITFKLSYAMANQGALPTALPGERLPSLGQLAVLDETKSQFTTQVLKFKRDCEKCVPDLQLSSSSKKTLAVGAEDYIVDVTIKNAGDSAYNPKLFVTIPDEVSRKAVMNATDSTKEEVTIDHLTGETVVGANNDTLLDIDIGKDWPLKDTMRIRIRLDTRRFSRSEDFLSIQMSVNSSNAEDPATMADNTLNLNITITSKADIEVNGSAIESEQVSYGGEVVGESAMVSEEDIGNEVRHKYYVRNRGPDLVPNAEIVIDWPFEAESGKHLLYLMDVEIQPVAGNNPERRCFFKPGQKNMLNLKVKPRSYEVTSEKDTSNTTARHVAQRRRRRAAEDEDEKKVRRDTEENSSKKNTKTELDCARGTARCTKIRCTSGRLQVDDEVTFTVRSRLWNGTLLEDYKGQQVEVVSRASVKPAVVFVDEVDRGNNKAEVRTQFNPDFPPLKKKGLPNWVIPVAVVGAVVLLAIIVFCLFKLGFFKRQKFEGNVMESEKGTKEEKQKIFGEVY